MSDTPRTDAEQWTIPDFPAEIADVVYAASARRLERELTAANARAGTAERLYRLLASAWFYGGWKAETVNEQSMEAVMREAGWWPFESEDALLAAIAAREKP